MLIAYISLLNYTQSTHIVNIGKFLAHIDNIQLKSNNNLANAGADINDGPVGLKLGETDKFISEKSPQNGIADNGAKEFNNHKSVPVEELNHKSRNAVTGNGSHSHLISEKMSANGSTRIENEIQEHKQLIPGESSKFVVEEFDVERVLEEQETHDLYCPNCRSCITKRVILRKRKRSSRENPSDLPPQKVPHVPEASPIPTETADHEDKTVFRCLSCLSFFIPTGTFIPLLYIQKIFMYFATVDTSKRGVHLIINRYTLCKVLCYYQLLFPSIWLSMVINTRCKSINLNSTAKYTGMY